MKHRFNKEEVRQWRLAGIPLDKLNDLYKPTMDYSFLFHKPVRGAIEDITRVLKVLELELPIKP